MKELAQAALAPLPSLDAAADGGDGLKACCAAAYEHPAVRWLLGGELHPGGERGTRRALDLAGVEPGARLVDVASGTGASALLAAREFGCDVVGVEYGDAAVDAAARAADDAGLAAQVRFIRGDAEALPVGDAGFDVALCECSLCTFPDKARALAELRRALRPGGRLVLCDVVVDRDRLPPALTGPLAAIACVGDALTAGGYEDLLRDAGFRLLAAESRDDDAAALARRVEDRLRGARILGFDRLAGAPLATGEAIALMRDAQAGIAEGALGYRIFVAVRD